LELSSKWECIVKIVALVWWVKEFNLKINYATPFFNIDNGITLTLFYFFNHCNCIYCSLLLNMKSRLGSCIIRPLLLVNGVYFVFEILNALIHCIKWMWFLLKTPLLPKNNYTNIPWLKILVWIKIHQMISVLKKFDMGLGFDVTFTWNFISIHYLHNKNDCCNHQKNRFKF